MIPITKPALGPAEIEATCRVVESGWLTQGPEVAAFERAFANYTGAMHACAVANCTVALHMALLAEGVGPGDEVITVSHSFIATANAIRHCGAKPVLVDIQPDSFNMDPMALAAAINPKTKAILCVHQMGMPCDLAMIAEIARLHDLPLIEDAACGLGSEIRLRRKWQQIGIGSDNITCFSFHPRKVVTTGDGGMLTTPEASADRLFRLLRQHGMSISDTARHGSATVLIESYPIVGYNYRMTDLQAAIGCEQLRRLPEIVARRRRLAAGYHERLAFLPGIQPPREPGWARSNWQSYCIRLPEGADQRQVMQGMLDRGVATRRGIMCIHREPAYQALGQLHSLTHSEQAQDGCILLPLYPAMTDEEQDQVIDALQASLPQAPRRNLSPVERQPVEPVLASNILRRRSSLRHRWVKNRRGRSTETATGV